MYKMNKIKIQKITERLEKKLTYVPYDNYEEILDKCEADVQLLKDTGVNVSNFENSIFSWRSEHETDMGDYTDDESLDDFMAH